MPDTYELYDGKGNLVLSEPLSPEQERDRRRQDLLGTDADMLRVVEDIIEVLTPQQKAALPQAVRDKVAKRQALRAEIAAQRTK